MGLHAGAQLFDDPMQQLKGPSSWAASLLTGYLPPVFFFAARHSKAHPALGGAAGEPVQRRTVHDALHVSS